MERITRLKKGLMDAKEILIMEIVTLNTACERKCAELEAPMEVGGSMETVEDELDKLESTRSTKEDAMERIRLKLDELDNLESTMRREQDTVQNISSKLDKMEH